MTGNEFINALKAAVAPATIASMFGEPGKRDGTSSIVFRLSDGREIKAQRTRIKSDGAEYVAELTT